MLNRPAVKRAVIPAAGFGTRMLPATKAVPKEMLPVAGKPLIQYAVDEAVASGIETVVFVVRNRKSLIEEYFTRDSDLESILAGRNLPHGTLTASTESVDLKYVQQEKPLGLAHAICCAKPSLANEPFVVLLPDVIMVNEEPVTLQLIRAYEQNGGSVVAIRQVEARDVERHGIVKVEDMGARPSKNLAKVRGLVEKPSVADAPSNLGVFGRYLLEPSIWDAIDRTKPDARGEVQLTEALNLLCQSRHLSGLCFQGKHYDAGDRLGYLKANIELSLLDPRLQPHLREYLSRLLA